MLDDTSRMRVTLILPYPPRCQLWSFIARPCIIMMPFPVSTSVSGVIFPSSKCHHDRGGLEGGARFQHVADGVVAHFVILSVARFHHIDDCLYLSGLHFHQYGDAHIGVDFLQFVYQCLFTNVLHAHIDGGDDVATVYGSDVHYVQVFVHHLGGG